MNQEYLIPDIMNKKIDLIIICNPIREEEIFDELTTVGISRKKIISIVDLVYMGESK